MNILKKNKGIFIVIEGIDGSGKTTLAKNLFNFYKNNNVSSIYTREPFASSLNLEFRNLFEEYHKKITEKNYFFEYLLFAAERSIHIQKIIKPALLENKLIICDRFLDSSIIYQGLLGSVDLEFINNVYNKTSFNIKPDLTIYCNVDENIALSRIKNRGIDTLDNVILDKISNLKKVYDDFYKEEKFNNKNVIFLNMNLKEEEILNNAIIEINNFFNRD